MAVVTSCENREFRDTSDVEVGEKIKGTLRDAYSNLITWNFRCICDLPGFGGGGGGGLVT